jgi:hypothetical protein
LLLGVGMQPAHAAAASAGSFAPGLPDARQNPLGNTAGVDPSLASLIASLFADTQRSQAALQSPPAPQ